MATSKRDFQKRVGAELSQADVVAHVEAAIARRQTRNPNPIVVYFEKGAVPPATLRYVYDLYTGLGWTVAIVDSNTLHLT